MKPAPAIATQRPMAIWRRNSAPGQRLRAMLVKRWPKIRSRCLFPATGSWRPAVRLAVFPRRAARRPRSACLRWRALISSRRDRLSNLWGSEMCALRHSRSDEPCGHPTPLLIKKQDDRPCQLAYEKNAEGYGLTRGNNEVVLGPLPDRPLGSHAPARLALARQDRSVLTEPGRKADAEKIGHQTARQEALRFSLICSARLAPGFRGKSPANPR
jgi:hypothetical protein